MRYIQNFQTQFEKLTTKYAKEIRATIIVILAILVHIYLGFAIARNFDKAVGLVVLFGIGWIFFVYYSALKPMLGAPMYKYVYEPVNGVYESVWKSIFVRW